MGPATARRKTSTAATATATAATSARAGSSSRCVCVCVIVSTRRTTCMSERSQPEVASLRMDAARRLLRTPPSPSTSSEQSQRQQPQVEWSSPSFTRARARPSNLHSYLRTSPSFPLSAQQQQQPLTRTSNDAPPSSSSSAGRSAHNAASGHTVWTKRADVRSQRSQATQVRRSSHAALARKRT